MIFQIFEQLCACAEDFVKAVDMEANTGKSFQLERVRIIRKFRKFRNLYHCENISKL